MQVTEVDPADETALRRWWEAEQTSARAGRPHAILRTWTALRASVAEPGPYYRRHLLALHVDGAVAGTADVGLPQRDNTHLAEVEVNVVPALRRRGLGRALASAADDVRRAAGRTTVTTEVYDPAGIAFGAALGMEPVHEEDHLVLTLPVPADHVAGLEDTVARAARTHEVVVWGNRCPDEHAAAYCAMLSRMSEDVPSGDADTEAVAWDEQRLRTSEERLARAYDTVNAAVRRRSDGRLGGYSKVFVPHGETEALQDDTFVAREHRGDRLGLLLKLATLQLLRRDHPEVRAVHTWTEPDNVAMHRTNLAFGFTVAERMRLLQRRDPA